MVKKRKSGLLQRMMAVLLSAVLVVGMVSNAVPVTVFAQEDGETVGNTQAEEPKEPAQEETKSEEPDTDKPDGSEDTDSDEPEDSDPEDKEDSTPEDPNGGAEQDPPEPDEETGEEVTEPGTEEENESESVGDNDAPTESVSENNITGENNDFQALIARIAALPDAGEYLAGEPDADSGEVDEAAYEEWLAGLYAYAEEAFAIQEVIEELSEEAQAAIPEEALAKLAAWVELAQTLGESAQVMVAESSMVMAAEPAAQTGIIAGGEDKEWILYDDGRLIISSDTGMSNWKKWKNSTDGSSCTTQVISVEIQNGVTSIISAAFQFCTNLTSITIQKPVTKIDSYAFNGCTALTSITIPESVTEIGKYAFYSCGGLAEITIPENVTSIGSCAFSGCSSLVNVRMMGENPPIIYRDTFITCKFFTDKTKGIHIPSCKYLDVYLNSEYWESYVNIIDAPHTGGVSYSWDLASYEVTQWCKGCSTEFGTATFSMSGNYFYYTGEEIKPFSVTYADSAPNTWIGEKTTEFLYKDNINVGTGRFYIKYGAGGGDGVDLVITFTIAPKPLTNDMITLSADSYPHTGNPITPEVTVTHGNKVLAKDTDYTVSYTNNSGVGTAAVTVMGMGNYGGTAAKEFQIVESDAEKVAAAKTVVEAALAGITATNATTKEEILTVINTALGNANITGVTVEIDKFVKREASTSAVGNIAGVVTITCGQESDTVHMDKPIAQLTAGKYMVAVNNGTGGGEYAQGSTVTITANEAPSGKEFDKWVVISINVDLADATSSTTTFTMPAGAVSVTATYKDKSGGGNQGSGNQGGDNPGGGDSGSSGGNNGGDHSGGSGNSGSSHGGNNGGTGTTDGMSGGGNQGSGSDGNNQNGSSSGNGGAGSTSGTAAPAPAGQPKVKQEKEGNIQKEVKVTGENTLDASMTAPVSELADTVLTQTEKQQAAEGTAIRIVLDVKDASAFVSTADKAAVEAALGSSTAKGYTLGQYLDVSLYKVIGDSRNVITQTNGKIRVTIDVPDSLKNTDGMKTRTFAVIRVHDGKAVLLTDLDNDEDTVTIETDRFSTYAIVYQDTANADGGTRVMNLSADSENVTVNAKSDGGRKAGGGMDDEPQTGDSTPIELSATLAMIAGFTYLLLYFADRKRGMTEETKKELVSRLIGWGKQGGKIRKYLALAAIFVLLVYYHSIGKKTCVEWKEIYGE